MTDPDTFGALRDIFSTLDGRVDAANREDAATAEELFAYYDRPGGDVDALDAPPTITHEPVHDINTWTDPWPATYGLDASTTRPLQFSNGLLLGAANAKLGVAGTTDEPALATESTATTVAYFNDEDFDISGLNLAYETVESHLFRFPTLSSRERTLPEWVTAIARTFAEGRHARRLVERIDGPLFIDGPVYPSRVVLWTLFTQIPGVKATPIDIWPAMIRDILTNYLRVVEQQDRADLPVVGVVKSPASTQAVTTLEAKAPNDVETPLRWENDTQFFSEALYTPADRYGDDGAIISYTSWLVQRRLTDKRTGTTITPFEDLDGVALRRGDAGEYQKAFFYVRIPLRNTVLRIEAPLLMVRDEHARDQIQRKVLVELATTRGIPFAIAAADDAATISRANRQQLRSELQHATPIRTYNQRRGYNDLEDTH